MIQSHLDFITDEEFKKMEEGSKARTEREQAVQQFDELEREFNSFLDAGYGIFQNIEDDAIGDEDFEITNRYGGRWTAETIFSRLSTLNPK